MPTLKTTTPPLLAGFGTLALVAGIGLAVSRPAHTAGGPIAVTVANTPLTVSSTDSQTRQPFRASTVYRFSGSDTFAQLDTQDNFAPILVPLGKRLMVQTVGVTADGGDGSSRFQASIAGSVAGGVAYFPLPIVSDFGIPFAGAAQSVTLCVDGGSAVGFSLVRASPVSTQYVRVAVYGYLLWLLGRCDIAGTVTAPTSRTNRAGNGR